MTGWQSGFKVISAIQLIRQYSSLDLAESKTKIDRLIEGECFQIDIHCDAEMFKKKMEALGGVIDLTGLQKSTDEEQNEIPI